MTVSSNIPINKCCNCGKFSWSKHAMERKQERDITLDPANISIDHVLSLPHYTNNGCYHYCDSKEGITYYGNLIVYVEIIYLVIVKEEQDVNMFIKHFDFDLVYK